MPVIQHGAMASALAREKEAFKGDACVRSLNAAEMASMTCVCKLARALRLGGGAVGCRHGFG